jgi:hypothetical protein
MIRTVFGVAFAAPRSRPRPSRRRSMPAPPHSTARPSTAASSPKGRPERGGLLCPAPGGACGTASRCGARPTPARGTRLSAADETAWRGAQAPVSARLPTGALRARSFAPPGVRRWSPCPVRARTGRARTCARGRGWAGASGRAGTTASTAVASCSGGAAAGAEAGAGAGGGGTVPPPLSPGGSTDPGVEAGRKSSGSRYPCSSAVVRIPRYT